MSSGPTIPDNERLARGQVAVKLRLDPDTLATLDMLVHGNETRQTTLRRLIREAAARLAPAPKAKRGKLRKTRAN